jgi:phage terminase large subunit-like protein
LSSTIERAPASRASASVAGGIDPPERIVEQPQRHLERQHAPHRLVEPRDGHLLFRDEVGQVFEVKAALHRHVDAGEERQFGRLACVGGEAMCDQLLVAGIVRDDQPAEAPFAT